VHYAAQDAFSGLAVHAALGQYRPSMRQLWRVLPRAVRRRLLSDEPGRGEPGEAPGGLLAWQQPLQGAGSGGLGEGSGSDSS
jgi:hypothetical protein